MLASVLKIADVRTDKRSISSAARGAAALGDATTRGRPRSRSPFSRQRRRLMAASDAGEIMPLKADLVRTQTSGRLAHPRDIKTETQRSYEVTSSRIN
jgi:hypothetical protein